MSRPRAAAPRIELSPEMLTPGQRRVLDRVLSRMYDRQASPPLETIPAAPLPECPDHPGRNTSPAPPASRGGTSSLSSTIPHETETVTEAA